MKIVIVALLLLATSISIAHAIDLAISSATVVGNDITLQASISGTTNNYYLQGLLRASDSSKYFGETKNNRGDWIDYISSPEKEYISSNFFLTDIKDASWSGTLNLRFKTDDINYKGPGNYELKIRRFTGNSSTSAGDSNIVILNLTASLPTPSPSIVSSPTPSPSPSPTSVVPSPSAVLNPTAQPSPSLVVAASKEGTVAGEVDIDLSSFGFSPSPSPLAITSNTLKLNYARAKIIIMIGSGMLLISVAGFFGIRHFLKNKEHAL